MNELKSMDYLQELVNNYGKETTLDFLANIGYLLSDNNCTDGRMFVDNLSEVVEDEL